MFRKLLLSMLLPNSIWCMDSAFVAMDGLRPVKRLASQLGALESVSQKVRTGQDDGVTDGAKSYICKWDGCVDLDKQIFSSAQELEEHICKTHIAKGERRCQWEGCGVSIGIRSHLKAHVRVHTGYQPYACAVCGKLFKHKVGMSKHQQKHSEVVEAVEDLFADRAAHYDCKWPDCGGSFTRIDNLYRHEREHVEGRPFVCPEPGCGRSFTQSGSLRRHERVHTGEKPFVCPKPGCGKSYTQSNDLYFHQRVKQHMVAEEAILSGGAGEPGELFMFNDSSDEAEGGSGLGLPDDPVGEPEDCIDSDTGSLSDLEGECLEV